MPNQRDVRKKLLGGFVDPRIKQEAARLGGEEATGMEMLCIEALVRHGYMSTDEVEKLAENGRLRPGSVVWLRSKGVLKDPVPFPPEPPARKGLKR